MGNDFHPWISIRHDKARWGTMRQDSFKPPPCKSIEVFPPLDITHVWITQYESLNREANILTWFSVKTRNLPAGQFFDRDQDPSGWKTKGPICIKPYRIYPCDMSHIWPQKGGEVAFTCILWRSSRKLTLSKTDSVFWSHTRSKSHISTIFFAYQYESLILSIKGIYLF